MPMLDRDGVGIYYESHGQGPAILLSHGYSATCRMWDGQIAALRDRFRVIVWDMRGHGQSDVPADPTAYSEAATVGDMAALLDACDAESAVIARTVARRLYVVGVPFAPCGAGARTDAVRHRPGVPQRCSARHVECAGAIQGGRVGSARVRGAGRQRRGAHEPAPLARGPGRRGARHAGAAGRCGDPVVGTRSGCRHLCWSARTIRISSQRRTTWRRKIPGAVKVDDTGRRPCFEPAPAGDVQSRGGGFSGGLR